MRGYTIGQVCQLLKLEAHVLRYWEKEFPLLQPRKDMNGRRVYSSRDLRLLLRIKYLLHSRRFTIEGAREQLFAELSGDTQDSAARYDDMRSSLLNLFFTVKAQGQRLDESLGLQSEPLADDEADADTAENSEAVQKAGRGVLAKMLASSARGEDTPKDTN
jgi:DNA-binding transcriptional MerR regulator